MRTNDPGELVSPVNEFDRLDRATTKTRASPPLPRRWRRGGWEARRRGARQRYSLSNLRSCQASGQGTYCSRKYQSLQTTGGRKPLLWGIVFHKRSRCATNHSSVTHPSEADFTFLMYLYSVPRVAL